MKYFNLKNRRLINIQVNKMIVECCSAELTPYIDNEGFFIVSKYSGFVLQNFSLFVEA